MKAIALIRVSTLHQDLNQQTEAVIAEIIKDGIPKENIILIEEKESAVKLEEECRDTFLYMIKRNQSEVFDKIIVEYLFLL